jgi:hypothetical protein
MFNIYAVVILVLANAAKPIPGRCAGTVPNFAQGQRLDDFGGFAHKKISEYGGLQ